MIFSELYGIYYKTVAEVLKTAIDHPLQDSELHKIIEKNAFEESVLNIEPALKNGKWKLILPDGTTIIKNEPSMPMTKVQKQWLKAISLDPRIRLFRDITTEFEGIEPLFTPEDYYIFDQYSDVDPYTDENYIKNFRLILDAIKNKYPLSIEYYNHKGKQMNMVLLPKYLEYSEKDDKFRVIGLGRRLGGTVNLGRIISCEQYVKEDKLKLSHKVLPRKRSVIFELKDDRNALERVLVHFAHFEKQAEKIENNRYKITVNYDKDDETELVIRVLAFGPMIKVIAPIHFENLIKERLIRQKSCGL